MMQQRLFLFVILLRCLSLESKTLVYSFPKVDLVFFYSSEQSLQTTPISVATRLELAVGGKTFYSLNGSVVSETTLIVKTVRCMAYPSYSESCGGNSQRSYLFLEGIMDTHEYVLRIIDPNSAIKSLLHRLSSKEYRKKKFNLTCLLKPTSTSPSESRDPYSHPLSKTSLVGIIFLGTCAVLICGLCTVWCSIIYYRRFTQLRKNKKLREARAKSTQEMLDQSPVILFDPNNKDNDYTDDNPMCAICLESFQEKEKIRKLVCSHYYHINCIDSWLISHQSCPLCNRDVLHNSIPTISSSIIDRVNGQNNDNNQRI